MSDECPGAERALDGLLYVQGDKPQFRGAPDFKGACVTKWERLRSLTEVDVLILGTLEPSIVALWAYVVEDNLDIVITGRQRSHYLQNHPETEALEEYLTTTVLEPDLVYRNSSDPTIAIFYRRLNDTHFLRIAVRMQELPGRLKHSVLSYRLAKQREVLYNQLRCVWRRP